MKYLLLVVLLLSIYSTNCDQPSFGEANPPGENMSYNRMYNVQYPSLPPQVITTNYQEMLKDKSKMTIEMGIPDHVNLDKNVVIPGDIYEDPVFVNDKGETVTSEEAVAEQHEEGLEDEANIEADQENEEILAELHAAKINTPDEAHELILSKHAEIMIFLEDIAKLKWLNTNEKTIVGQIARYIQMLKNRHALIRNSHEEQIVQDLEVMIHQITIQLDEHTFNAHGMKNRAESIYHHMKENMLLERKLDATMNTAIFLLNKGEFGRLDAVIATQKLVEDAQKYVKIQNVRLTQDLCELEVPLRNRDRMTELVESYKDMQVAETKRVNVMIDAYEALIKSCYSTMHAQEHGQEEEALKHVQDMIKAADTPQNCLASLRQAETAHKEEDFATFETKVELTLERARYWMDKAVATAGSLIYQTQLIRKAEVSIKDGSAWMHSGYQEFNLIEDEVMNRQPMVVFTPVLEEKSLDVYHEVLTGNLKFAVEKTMGIKQLSVVHGYQELIGAKLPIEKTKDEEQDEMGDAESKKVERELKDLKGDIGAGNTYEANVKVDIVAGIIQRRVKQTYLRQAMMKVSDNHDNDKSLLESTVNDLRAQLDGEMHNLQSFKENQEKLAAHVEQVRDTALAAHPFHDAVESVEELAKDGSLTALEHLSVAYALKYARQDYRNHTQKFLNRANDQTLEEGSIVEGAIQSLEHQLNILATAEEKAQHGDGRGVNYELQRVVDEVEVHQVFCRIDNNIVEKVEMIKNLVLKGEAQDGTQRLEKLTEKYVTMPEESVAEKKRKQDLKDPRHPIEITAEPVVPIREPTTAQQHALDIEKDTASALEAIQGVVSESVSKEAACLEVEVVESQIQKYEKLDDINTTREKCRKAHEVNDHDSEVEALHDQEASITEEEVFLTGLKTNSADCREKITGLLEQIDDQALQNTAISKDTELVIMHAAADAGVRSYLRSAQQALSLDKRDKARNHVFDAKEHIERVLTNLDTSLAAVSKQLTLLGEAQDSADHDDFAGVATKVTLVYESAEQEQMVHYTDRDVNVAFTNIVNYIGESNIDQASDVLAKTSEKAQQTIREPITLQLVEGEQEARNEQAKVDAGATAFNAIASGSVAATQSAVDTVTANAQTAVKSDTIMGVVQAILEDENVDTGLVSDLRADISEEKSRLTSDHETLEHQVAKLQEYAHDTLAEDTLHGLQEINDEGVADASVQILITEAVNAIELQDAQKAQQNLEEAVDTMEVQLKATATAIASCESQEDKLEQATKALEDGDQQTAADLVRAVQQDTEDQPIVQYNGDVEELGNQAKEEASENPEKAVESVSVLAGHDITPPVVDWLVEVDELIHLVSNKNWQQAGPVAAQFVNHPMPEVVEQATLLRDTLIAEDRQESLNLIKRIKDFLHKDTVTALPEYEKLRPTESRFRSQKQAPKTMPISSMRLAQVSSKRLNTHFRHQKVIKA